MVLLVIRQRLISGHLYRLTLDAMITKVAKAKKEKDKNEAEEEMEIARIR